MTTIKERPILFRGPMVRAILEGRKTQTRRLVRPQVPEGYLYDELTGLFVAKGSLLGLIRSYPYGVPGDRLWVREKLEWNTSKGLDRGYLCYGADGAKVKGIPADAKPVTRKGLPGMFMSKWARRLWLEIVKVRVERLQDITEADAKAEGFAAEGDPEEMDVESPDGIDRGAGPGYFSPRTHIAGFMRSWDSHNAAPFDWTSNPWVWVVEFRRLKP